MQKFYKQVAIVVFFLVFLGCQSAPKKTFEFKTQVYFYSFENVWRAIMQSMSNYPMLSVNIENAKVETQYIALNEIWKPAHKKSFTSSTKRYKILVNLIEGKINKKRSIKVIVRKVISYKKNFFHEEKNLLSDGLEEEVILYRIKRELINYSKIKLIK